MKKMKIVSLVIIPVAIVAAIYFYNQYNLEVNVNERRFEFQLERRVAEIESMRGSRFEGQYDDGFYFFHLAGLAWSNAYIFQPGTTKSEIEAIIGFEDRNIPEVIREGYTQMLFVQDWWHISHRNVAANIHGRKPYRFYVEGFEGSNESYIKIPDYAKCKLEIEPDGTIKIILFDYTD